MSQIDFICIMQWVYLFITFLGLCFMAEMNQPALMVLGMLNLMVITWVTCSTHCWRQSKLGREEIEALEVEEVKD